MSSAVLPGLFLRKKRLCILCQCYEFTAVSFCGTVYLCILVPAKARLTFPGARRGTASSPGIFDPFQPCAAGTEGEGVFPGFALWGVGWATARGSLACVAHSVISIGVRARFSYFIAVCSQLFPSRPVILNVYVPSVLLSVLPRRREGGGRGKGSERAARAGVFQWKQ